jgi:hypothetical protein
MVCDIHTYVEQSDGNGAWRMAEWPEADAEKLVFGPFNLTNYARRHLRRSPRSIR